MDGISKLATVIDKASVTADRDSNPKSEKIAWWLALLRVPEVGPRRFLKLLELLGSPGNVYGASVRDLRSCGVPESSLRWLEEPDWTSIKTDLQWLAGKDRHVLLIGDSLYPAILREISDPPPLLFVCGNPHLLNHPHLAIVGSRQPTPGGSQTAFKIARALASTGLGITSGLALGIDAAAHKGAIAATGNTIAVAGTGLDRVYPARHRDLARKIAEQGALVSEFPPGTAVRADNFPRRNRIISGMSVGTLVVEAALQSGSLISARHALEQGREVFAVPGSINNPVARGCHALIRDGAKLVEGVEDILEELGHVTLTTLEPEEPTRPEAELPDIECRRLIDCLGYDPVSVDTLVERSGLTANSVSSMLLIMELEGQVSSLPGGKYVRYSTG